MAWSFHGRPEDISAHPHRELPGCTPAQLASRRIGLLSPTGKGFAVGPSCEEANGNGRHLSQLAAPYGRRPSGPVRFPSHLAEHFAIRRQEYDERMGGSERGTTAEELLAHTGWLRRLALRLVGDADVADDLVQETLSIAVRRSPETRDSLRPWLGKVLRDAFRMRARSETRRSAREQAASLFSDDVPTPEILVAKAEAQRLLVDLVLRLDEPYRDAVLLHFCEGVSLADIARAQGIPAGTVRRRVHDAIDQLRVWLDEAGERKRWAVTLLALPKGILVAQKSSKIAIGLVLLLLLLGGGIVGIVRHAGTGSRGDEAGGRPESTATSGSALWRVAGAERPLPDWLAQRGLKPRRVAGRVVSLEGAPIEGASVELASVATAAGLVEGPRAVTNAAGEFDLGPQAAMTYAVSASAPQWTGAAQSVDRDRRRRPLLDRRAFRGRLRPPGALERGHRVRR